MKNEKITLTDIEKEKLWTCVALVAKNFEVKRLYLEKALGENEMAGNRDDNLLGRIEHYRDRESFYENLAQKVTRAIENNQL